MNNNHLQAQRNEEAELQRQRIWEDLTMENERSFKEYLNKDLTQELSFGERLKEEKIQDM